jgi:hypothetical protein
LEIGRACPTLVPVRHDFEDVIKGDTPTQKFTISNPCGDSPFLLISPGSSWTASGPDWVTIAPSTGSIPGTFNVTISPDAALGVHDGQIKLDFDLVNLSSVVTKLSVLIQIQANIVQEHILCIADTNDDGMIGFDEAVAIVTAYLIDKDITELGRPPTFDEAVEVVTAYLIERKFTCPEGVIIQ